MISINSISIKSRLFEANLCLGVKYTLNEIYKYFDNFSVYIVCKNYYN